MVKKCGILAIVISLITFAIFADEPVLVTGKIKVQGLSLTVGPAVQQVPVSMDTIVETSLGVKDQGVVKGMVVKGELRGPGLSKPMSLTTLPDQPFQIPGLQIKGDYFLENIRVEREGKLLFKAQPESVKISVMDLVVSRVETRPLTLKEIRDKGIVITDENFTAYNFSVGMTIESNRVEFDFPVIYSGKDPEPKVLFYQDLNNPPVKKDIQIADQIAPVMFVPDLEAPASGGGGGDDGINGKLLGMLMFNNDIAFLNQFFSVMLVVANTAPDGSPIELKEMEATITFPEEGLRQAKTTPATIKGKPIPIRCPGPDEKLGTADDLTVIMATFSGMAEFLAEGLKEGTHYVKIDFTGKMGGMPGGDRPFTGTATGAVVVKNPEYSVTFAHPSVVRKGELYDIMMTVTNTSPVPANLLSIRLPASRMSGTKLLSEEKKTWDTILPGESQTAVFKMQSLQNGKVTATAFEADTGVKGQFVLTAGVGEKDIPLSPDTLILPDSAYGLPGDIVNPAMMLLGEAWSIATVPAGGLPENLPVVTREEVKRRIIDLAEAGRFKTFGEDDVNVLASLILDWQNNQYEYENFDRLRLLTTKGWKLADAVSVYFSEYIRNNSKDAFIERVATSNSWREPFILLAHERDSNSLLKLEDFYRNELYQSGEDRIREIPSSELYRLENHDFMTVGRVSDKGYKVIIEGKGDGTTGFTAVVPAVPSGFQKLEFSSVPVKNGSKAVLELNKDQTSFVLKVDLNGDGIYESQVNPVVTAVAEEPLRVVGVVQELAVDEDGQVFSILFNRKLDEESAVDSRNYSIENQRIIGLCVQPNGRMVAGKADFVISPFIDSFIEVKGIKDTLGRVMPDSGKHKIVAKIEEPGGVVKGKVYRADGSVVMDGVVTVKERSFRNRSSGGETGVNYVISRAPIINGEFTVKYVRQYKFAQISYFDPDTNKLAGAQSAIRTHGEVNRVNMVLMGQGRVKVKVLDTDGKPVQWARVDLDVEYDTSALSELDRDLIVGQLKPIKGNLYYNNTDANGEVTFDEIPVGRVKVIVQKTLRPDQTETGRGLTLAGFTETAIPSNGAVASAQVVVYGADTGTVKGRVLANDGVTPVKTYVGIYYPVPNHSGRVGEIWVETDENGYFEKESIPIGTIGFEAIYPEGPEDNIGARVVAGLGKDQILETSLIFRGTGTIKGKVLFYDGSPVEGATLSMSGRTLAEKSGADGSFSLTVPLPFHNSGITIGAEKEIEITADIKRKLMSSATVPLYYENQTINKNIVFSDHRTGGIRGTLYNVDGSPAVEKTVKICTGGYGVLNVSGTTDAQGKFVIDNVPPGAYLIYSTGSVYNVISRVAVTGPDHYPSVTLKYRGTGKLNLKVVNHNNSSGVKADVKFSRVAFVETPGTYIGFKKIRESLSTNENGELNLESMYVGSYEFEVGNAFYTPVKQRIAISTHGEIKNETVYLNRLGKLKVKVLSPEGTPQGGVAITLKKYGYSDPLIYTLTEPDAVNNIQIGENMFELISEGGFEVIAHDSVTGFKGNVFGSMDKSRMEQGLPTEVEISLKYTGIVNGQVKTAAGLAAGRAKVTYESIGFPYEKKEIETDNDGNFSFTGILEGEYTLSAFQSSTNLKGKVKGTLAGKDATVTTDVFLGPVGKIKGRVLFPGVDKTPAVNCQIVLKSMTGKGTAFAFGNDQGDFEIDIVPVGKYLLTAFDPTSSRRGETEIEIKSEGETVYQDVTLEKRGTVEGTFYDGSGTVPIAGARIQLRSEGTYVYNMAVNTDENGKFRFEQVGEGDFAITGTKPLSKVGGKAEGTINIEGETVSKDILCEPVGKVTGTVYKNDGTTPDPMATVQLISNLRLYNVTADPEGNYIVNDVAVGEFVVIAKERSGKDSGNATGKIDFDGDVSNVDITFAGFGKLTGIVNDGSGNPAADVELRIYSPGNRDLTRETRTTGADGRFEFSLVLPGNYVIEGRSPEGLGTAGDFVIESAGVEKSLTLQLQDAGTVKGQILKEDGTTPAAGALVTVKYSGKQSFVVADDNGNFSAAPVLTGNYEVIVEGREAAGLQRVSGVIDVNGEEDDLGAVVLDRTLPVVNSSVPETGSAAIALNSNITVTFSEPLMVSSVNNSNVKLSNSAGQVNGAVTLSGDGTTLTFTPSQPLQSFVPYTLVMNDVMDRAGNRVAGAVNISFTTLDVIPPSITAVNPVNGAVGIDTGARVTVQYNELVNHASVNSSTVSVLKNGTPVAGAISMSGDSTAVIFTPAAPLDTDTVYTVNVAPVRDIAGNQSAIWTGTFSTPDTERPVITMDPPAGGTSVIEQSLFRMTVQTSTPGDVAKVHFFVNGNIQATDTQAPYEADLRAPEITSQTTFLVEAVAEDSAGNFSNRVQITFTLKPDAAPTAQFENLSATELLPGESFAVTLKAVDDAEIKYAKFSAIGSTLNHVVEGAVSGKEWSRRYTVTIPGDIALGSKIDITGEVTDIKGHKVAASPLVVNIKNDENAPVVNITSPEADKTFNNKDEIVIAATATDDIGIKEVQFWMDDTHLGTDEQAPYDISYTVPPLTEDKRVTIKVVAVDDVNKQSEATVSVKLLRFNDITAPQIKMLSPAEGEHIFAGEKLKLKADVSDDEGVSSVEFKVNGTSVHTATATPYEFVYTVPEAAQVGEVYEVEVVATDVDNKVTTKKQSAIVVAGELLGDGTVIDVADTTYDNKTVIVKAGTVTINGAHNFTHLLVKETGVVTHAAATTSETSNMSITAAGQITVGIDAKLSATAKGYLQNRTLGNTTTGASTMYSGGSHGGYGGQWSSNIVAKPYGSVYRPVTHGSGAGSGCAGGGVLFIKAAKLVNSGSVESDGESRVNVPGGAGGSVLLEVADIVGTGTIKANGSSTKSSGGGGGRVAIYYNTLSVDQIVTAYGGVHNNHVSSTANGSAGTVYLKNNSEARGQVIVNNNGHKGYKETELAETKAGTITAVAGSVVTDSAASFTTDELKGMLLEVNGVRYTIISNTDKDITVDPAGQAMPNVGDKYSAVDTNDLVIEGNAKLTGNVHYKSVTVSGGVLVADSLLKADDLSVIKGGVITHSPATNSEVFTLYIEAKSITVDATSKISTEGKGYLQNRTLGNTNTGASTMYSGGSHGGAGGQWSSNIVADTYGSIYKPVTHGSGGGSSNETAGGGVLFIKATEIDNSGSIDANGAGTDFSPGSAGGSVFIQAGIIRGNGVIAANGANSLRAGTGGGGRVALYYTTLEAGQKVSAYGGTFKDGSAASANGAAGTVYLKKDSDVKGQIVIDNNGLATVRHSNLKIPARGTVTEVNGAVLTDSNGTFIPGMLEGFELVVEDTHYTVISNSATEITVETAGKPAIEINKEYGFHLPSELVISNNTILIADTPLDTWKINLEKGSVLTHSAATTSSVFSLNLKTDTLTIDETSKISVTGKGYLQNRTLGNTTVGASSWYSGGSHGGKGGNASDHPVSDVYGDMYKPVTHGSGSGVHCSGGGVIYISAREILSSGSIEADGQYRNDVPGGAGGSVYIETDAFSGKGKVSANGAASGFHSGGGGGRVAVYYNTMATELKLSAFGGKHKTGVENTKGNGGSGTVYLKKKSADNGKLIISNDGAIAGNGVELPAAKEGTITALNGAVVSDSAATYLNGELIGKELSAAGLRYKILSNTDKDITVDPAGQALPVVGTKYLIFDTSELEVIKGSVKASGILGVRSIVLNESTMVMDGTIKADSLVLKANSTLTHSEATDKDLYTLTVDAKTVNIDTTSKISVTGKGYIKGRSLGNTADMASNVFSGGSHGGIGGRLSDTNAGDVYGSLYWPLTHGAGSGVTTNNPGGGVVNLKSDNLILNGVIESDGQSKNGDAAGAGGSALVEAKAISGIGRVTANGGNSTNRTAGGGGRVAVYYDSIAPEIVITAYGGVKGDGMSDDNANGGAGTVFLKINTDELGSLLVDNNDMPTRRESTPLPFIGNKTSTEVGDSSISINEYPRLVPGALVGMYVNPDKNGSNLFRVTSNTELSITTDPADGKISDSANAGAIIIGVHKFKNIYVRSGAFVKTSDRVFSTGVEEITGTLEAENREGEIGE